MVARKIPKKAMPGHLKAEGSSPFRVSFVFAEEGGGERVLRRACKVL